MQKNKRGRWLCFIVGISVFLIVSSSYVIAGNYSLSAHSDPDYGVSRSGMPAPYQQGNCAHCHEQHASIDGDEIGPDNDAPSRFALFADPFSGATQAPYSQSDLFCFYCHCDIADSLQDDFSAVIPNGTEPHMTNNDYSATFGLASGGPDDIMEAFNQAAVSPGSNHNLLGLQNYGKANLPFFKDNSDPCTVCHNPHIARRNKENLGDSSYATISLPSEHSDHWGDDVDEQMSHYSSNYRAPYVFNSTTAYEPGGFPIDADHAATLMPDYNTFCLQCHGTTSPDIVSVNLGRTLRKIDWAATGGTGDVVGSGDKHGVNVATGDVDTIPPYSNTFDLVLSCCDCHEPHGSPYATLIRRSINGTLVDPIGNEGNGRGNQCRQCHKDDYELTGDITRKNKWQFTHHGARAQGDPADITDNPYVGTGCFNCHYGSKNNEVPIPCEDCHGHGRYVEEGTQIYTDPTDAYPTRTVPAGQLISGPRKTF